MKRDNILNEYAVKTTCFANPEKMEYILAKYAINKRFQYLQFIPA